jgi:hypothetical protein
MNRLFAPTLNAAGSIQIKQNKINTKTLHNRMKGPKYPLSLILIPSVIRSVSPDQIDEPYQLIVRTTRAATTGGVRPWWHERGKLHATQRCRPTCVRVAPQAARGRPAQVGVRPREARAPPREVVAGGARSAPARPWTTGRASEGAAAGRAGGGATAWRPAAAPSGRGGATRGVRSGLRDAPVGSSS